MHYYAVTCRRYLLNHVRRGGLLKPASIMSVRVKGADQFGWIWRAADGHERSQHVFRYFHDCREDARKAGYACRFAGLSEDSGPASSPTCPASTRTTPPGRDGFARF